jgi:hypothetical protein
MILCQEIIWLSTDKVNTYCMREKGHPGKHNIVNEEPIESCTDAMCWFAINNVDHIHPDPADLTKARVKVDSSRWLGVWGTNG